MAETTNPTRRTEEGTEYRRVGGRAVIPTPEHGLGGGVALAAEALDEILAALDGGARETGQLEWEDTVETIDTRVGESRVIEVAQTSFGTTRTTELSVVDLADLELEVGQ